MNNKIAVLFPGQASQQIGMLSDLAKFYVEVKETFSEASEVVHYDLWKLVQYGSIEELNQTYKAQPAILTASVAIWRIWKKEGLCTPAIMAGHSLGEYSALVCAESIDFPVAVKLVMIRGVLMQETVPYGIGAMSAIIGLNDDIVCTLCARVVNKKGNFVAPSAFNAPGHIVISGYKESVHDVNTLCKEAGAKHVVLLPISIPAHCILMKPMIKKFKKRLERIIIRSPNIPVINNAEVQIEQDPEYIRQALLYQLYMAVRWKEIIQYLIYQKVNIFLEMGPKKVLTGFVRNIFNEVCSLHINDSVSLKKAMKIIEK